MHADTLNLSYQAGATINRAGQLSLLTDAGVAAADTLDGLTSFVNNAAVHADQQNYKARVIRAWSGGSQAEITNSTVAGLTTVAGLAALTAVGSNTGVLGLFPDV